LRAEFRSALRARALASGGVRSSVRRPFVWKPGSVAVRRLPVVSSIPWVVMAPSTRVVVRGDDQPLRVFADQALLAELSDPDGRSVALLARIWEDKITKDHPELRGQLEHVLATVAKPEHAEPDPRGRRRRYYRRPGGSEPVAACGRRL
jgi:hypothetical protein